MTRPSWDEYWMMEAYLAAQMCTCARGRKQGAVFVKDNHLLVKGFNGVPTKFPHPTVCLRNEKHIDTGCDLDMCGCRHAEDNCINNAARLGISVKGATVYCTSHPCINCMGQLANTDVVKVVYHNSYPSSKSAEIAQYAGITVEQFPGSKQLDLLISAFPPARYGPRE